MQRSDGRALRDRLTASGSAAGRFLWGSESSIALDALSRGTSLSGSLDLLRGRSVLLAAKDQLAAALALIELDGIARRLVLCPPDLPHAHIRFVIGAAAIDAVVADRAAFEAGVPRLECSVTCSQTIEPAEPARAGSHRTEWVLLTSGTTGVPKLVRHTLSSLTGAIAGGPASENPIVWSTFYDIRRYGGLQIFLRAMCGGASLMLSGIGEPATAFLARAASLGVTHISGTPSHWRRALMSSMVHKLAPRYVRLSGEIADQAILDRLRAVYPAARIAHAFASTEAGLAFDVVDGLAGFPASLVGQRDAPVELKIEAGSLRIRSARTAIGYLGDRAGPLANEDGFIDTGDMVELRGDRYHFVGRKGGIINVGGLKVHPEEVEAIINLHPGVQMSRVKARRNPITGAVVAADVVACAEPGYEAGAPGREALKTEILEACRRSLAPYKVPAVIRFLPSLDVAGSGKLARVDA